MIRFKLKSGFWSTATKSGGLRYNLKGHINIISFSTTGNYPVKYGFWYDLGVDLWS